MFNADKYQTEREQQQTQFGQNSFKNDFLKSTAEMNTNQLLKTGIFPWTRLFCKKTSANDEILNRSKHDFSDLNRSLQLQWN